MTRVRRWARHPRPVQARATVRGVILLQLAANGAGGVVVCVYLRLLFPLSLTEGTPRDQGIDITVFSLYLAATLALAFPINRIVLRRAVQWVRDGRPPTPEERRDTLLQPFRQTASAFLVWVGAAITFGLLNENATRVAGGIVLAGLVCCSLLFLLLERHFRPIFALALVDAELPLNRREILPKIMMAWFLGSAVPILGIGLAPLSLSGNTSELDLTWRVTILVFTSIVAGGLVMRAAAGAVADPINRVRDAMRKVEDGDLDASVPVDDIGEIGRLSAGFNSMVEGLRERRQLHDLLGRQVGTDVARHSLEHEPTLGGELRVVTVLFVDLTGYTAFAEQNTPERVVTTLNAFFQVVVDVVTREGGWVNKFEGDAALCIFGAPLEQDDHAARGLRAAARLPAEVSKLAQTPRAGVGVATGEVVAGNIGTAERYEYTVIGDAVNIASRLSDIAKTFPTCVLASADTIAAAGGATDEWAASGVINLRGRMQDVEVFEPAGAQVQTVR